MAMVVLEEMSRTSPGSSDWLTWRDIFHLIDIICCCAILFPIVWSIRHLRQAAGADGKAEHNLMKLTLFRQVRGGGTGRQAGIGRGRPRRL